MVSNLLSCQHLAVVLFSVFIATPAFSFTGQVIGVMDGDTIEVLPSAKPLHKNKPQRIRLYGIDCPETRQAFGTRAKQATSALVFAKIVTVESHGRDKYSRIVGDVFLPDGTNVNRELVAQGWCWHYEKYAPDDLDLAVLELAARGAMKGLWADPDPMPPWEWRKLRRGNRLELSGLP